MTKESTYKKIYEIESKYGSLVNALEGCKISKSTYCRYREIVLSKQYIEYVMKEKEKKLEHIQVSDKLMNANFSILRSHDCMLRIYNVKI